MGTAKFELEAPNSISAARVATSAKPVRKYVRNGEVFIEYGDKTYTIQGIETK